MNTLDSNQLLEQMAEIGTVLKDLEEERDYFANAYEQEKKKIAPLEQEVASLKTKIFTAETHLVNIRSDYQTLQKTSEQYKLRIFDLDEKVNNLQAQYLKEVIIQNVEVAKYEGRMQQRWWKQFGFGAGLGTLALLAYFSYAPVQRRVQLYLSKPSIVESTPTQVSPKSKTVKIAPKIPPRPEIFGIPATPLISETISPDLSQPETPVTPSANQPTVNQISYTISTTSPRTPTPVSPPRKVSCGRDIVNFSFPEKPTWWGSARCRKPEKGETGCLTGEDYLPSKQFAREKNLYYGCSRQEYQCCAPLSHSPAANSHQNSVDMILPSLPPPASKPPTNPTATPNEPPPTGNPEVEP